MKNHIHFEVSSGPSSNITVTVFEFQILILNYLNDVKKKPKYSLKKKCVLFSGELINIFALAMVLSFVSLGIQFKRQCLFKFRKYCLDLHNYVKLSCHFIVSAPSLVTEQQPILLKA